MRCFGEVRKGPKGLEIVHPEYRLVNANVPAPIDEHLTPIYPATEGVTQGRLRMLVRMALDETRSGDIEDHLPPALIVTVSHDPPGMREIGPLVAGHAPDAVHVELDSDHYVTLREPELLSRVLLDFLVAAAPKN